VVSNHDCYREDAVELGTGRYGTPIRINREVVEADLVIALGMITNRGFAYASGGAKIILPGVAHVDTIRRNHRSESG
jgi:nickel-dependent lactate racemase